MSSDFPNRPDHPDFWLLSETMVDIDSAADDGTSADRVLNPMVDSSSVMYAASQRGLRAHRMLSGGRTAFAAAWLDGFMVGALYRQRRLERKMTRLDEVQTYADRHGMTRDEAIVSLVNSGLSHYTGEPLI